MRYYVAWICMFTAVSLAAAENDWQTIIRTEQRAMVENPARFVSQIHAKLAAGAEGRAEIPKVEALLVAETVPITDADLLGPWKCRSIQGSSQLGIFAYPPFAAQITRAKDGRLLFDKTGGSQLRQGYLYPAGPGRRVFLGEKRVRGEPAGRYSRLYPADQVDGETMENDSVGVLTRKKDGRLLLILDASADSYEIYELAR